MVFSQLNNFLGACCGQREQKDVLEGNGMPAAAKHQTGSYAVWSTRAPAAAVAAAERAPSTSACQLTAGGPRVHGLTVCDATGPRLIRKSEGRGEN